MAVKRHLFHRFNVSQFTFDTFFFTFAENSESWRQGPGRPVGLWGVCALPPGPREEAEAGVQKSRQKE